jgi:hypothetical protein
MSTTLRHFMLRRLIVLLACVGASGCAANPNAPSSVTGTWVGTVASNLLGNESYQFTLTQSGSAITGFYTFTSPGSASSGGGSLTGTLEGSSFAAVLPFGTCTRTLTGTLSGTTLTGTFAATGVCGNPDLGTFTLTLE